MGDAVRPAVGVAEREGAEKVMELSLTEQLMFSTVRIEVTFTDDRIGTGTGFFFNLLDDGSERVPVIVTNRHVVTGTVTGRFQLTIALEDGTPDVGNVEVVELDQFEQRWLAHPDPEVDLCVMPLSPIITEAQKRAVNFFQRSMGASLIPSDEKLLELMPAEEILMVGYPIGIWDSVNNLPVFRQGIAATHPGYRYDGRDEFLIDAACYPGSSGSPVLIVNQSSYRTREGITFGSRALFLGVLFGGFEHTLEGEITVVEIPTQNVPIAKSLIPINLGRVIRASKILDFEAAIKAARENREGSKPQ